MRKETNLCMSCMGELNDHGTCPLCGYFDTESYISSYLAPKTFLSERYIVGKLIGYSGESALYIGFDTETGRKVTIREYMPDTLCVRERDEEIVSVRSNKLPLYKTYLAEFIELHTTLMRSPNIRCVQPVLNVFTQNNTAYAVMEYIGGISLKAYLTNCGEVMTWEQIKELFPPVLTALSMLHGLGIIHRGISTSTIFVSEKNELRLIGFSISAAHTADSDIGYEVFGGYAAPELYSSSKRNGSWTDVYGISAVLYRCLTGVIPPSAPDRLTDDTLTDPMLISRHVPKNVSDVIMRGMRLDAEERTATITEFVDRLFEQPVPAEEYSSEITMPVSRPSSKSAAGGSTHTDSSRSHSDGNGSRNVNKIGTANGSSARTSGGGKNKKKRKRKSDRDKIKFILVSSVLGIIILAFIIAMIVTASEGEEEKTSAATTRAPVTVPTVTSAEESVSVSETTASAQGGGYVLPNFEGAFYTTVSTNPQYSYLVFQATFDFSSEYKSGQIISQTVPEGTVVQSGTEIGVIVSKGPEKLPLPDYTGKKVEDYVKELSDSGIKYRIEEEITDETEEGLVARCSKEIGEDVMVAVSEEVVVYVAVKPEQTTTSLNAMEWEDDESTDLSADTSSGAENTSYTEDNGGDTIIFE
ncbi:MAG: PASTA domain-containing protein [Ruminiclostridium sp.]|nr:PASTA domain-containing protein [Ruminiclostridium sp.]